MFHCLVFFERLNNFSKVPPVIVFDLCDSVKETETLGFHDFNGYGCFIDAVDVC